VVSRLVWCVSYREQLLTRVPTLYTGVVSPKYFEKATAVVVAPEP
jgi:tetrahydromethanopterin S-methyltransferase subunit F